MSAITESLKLEDEKKLREAAKAGDLSLVEALIKKGVNVNAVGAGTMRNALHWAAQEGHEAIVAVLLKAGINPLQKDSNKSTPLEIATALKFERVVALLQKHSTLDAREIKAVLDEAAQRNSKAPPEKHDVKKMKVNVAGFLERDLEPIQKQLIQNLDKIRNILSSVGELVLKLNVANKLELSQLTEEDDVNYKKMLSAGDPSFALNRFFRAVRALLSSFSDERLIYTGLTNVIAEYLLCLNEIELRIQNSITDAPKLIKEEGTQQKFIKASQTFLKNTVRNMQEFIRAFFKRFNFYIEDVDDYINFIKQNFPGDLIEHILLLPLEMNRQKVTPEIVRDRIRHKNQILIKIFTTYFEHLREKTEVFLKNKQADHQDNLISIPTESGFYDTNSFYDGARKFVNDIIQIVLKRTQSNLLDLSNDNVLIGNVYHIYEVGKKIFAQFQEILKNLEKGSEKILEERFDNIRRDFLNSMSLSDKQGGHIDHVAHHIQLEQDKMTTQALSRERESKARGEAKEARDAQNALMRCIQDLEKQKAMAEQKTKMEQEGFRKQFLQHLTQDQRKQIYEFLSNPNIILSDKEFRSIVDSLKIPQESSSRNSNTVVFKAGTLYTFTYHKPHGKKRKNVDPANLAHLRKLLHAVGINKDNFEELAEKLKSEKKSP